jgi:hypothetical protein
MEVSNSFYLDSALNEAVWYKGTDKIFSIEVFGRGLQLSAMYLRLAGKGVEIIKTSLENGGIEYKNATSDRVEAELVLKREDFPGSFKLPGILSYSLQLKDEDNFKFEIDNGVVNLRQSNVLIDW